MTDLLAGVDEIVANLKPLTFDYLDRVDVPLKDRVITRLEDIKPPCIWVAVESIDHLSSAGELLARIFLIATAIDEYRAISALSPLLEVVLSVVSPTEATTVVEVNPTFQTKGLPALRVTTSLVI
ncbi:hypothetical protein [Aeromicrobium sp. 9AM]|uniref:hypothetical protein n=1 Tax=Aeromicrobium sp. 9AM TaxID=2653126 RepID=UPI0012F111FE|nr:hypothetical protein [Aeromicrobium sp. 9AM]VXC21227.1 hypothetical protein AERO9AM_50378 [Aeromicrobium sp. 9AM]